MEWIVEMRFCIRKRSGAKWMAMRSWSTSSRRFKWLNFDFLHRSTNPFCIYASSARSIDSISDFRFILWHKRRATAMSVRIYERFVQMNAWITGTGWILRWDSQQWNKAHCQPPSLSLSLSRSFSFSGWRGEQSQCIASNLNSIVKLVYFNWNERNSRFRLTSLTDW